MHGGCSCRLSDFLASSRHPANGAWDRAETSTLRSRVQVLQDRPANPGAVGRIPGRWYLPTPIKRGQLYFQCRVYEREKGGNGSRVLRNGSGHLYAIFELTSSKPPVGFPSIPCSLKSCKPCEKRSNRKQAQATMRSFWNASSSITLNLDSRCICQLRSTVLSRS